MQKLMINHKINISAITGNKIKLRQHISRSQKRGLH